MIDRVGYYCWGGPGTLRMIDLKYFSPKKNTDSILHTYDTDYLARVKEKLGLTDIWVTYSWGFSPKIEQQDYEFIATKLPGIKSLGLRVHAYLQGPNLVYSQFPDQDWWCRDDKNRLVPYHRGRCVVSLCSQEFREYKKRQIIQVAQLGFDGVFVDNIQMGQMGIPDGEGGSYIFAGSTDKHTLKSFSEVSGINPIPTNLHKSTPERKAYLDFRVQSTSNFLREIASTAREYNLEFGTNSFDPKYDTRITFGTDLSELSRIQDYLLFENHSLPNGQDRSNKYIDELAKSTNIKTFLVTYKKGIGEESAFTQEDLDMIFSEARNSKFFPAIKGSEFVTNNVWHNLEIDKFKSPRMDRDYQANWNSTGGLNRLVTVLKPIMGIARMLINPLSRFYLNNRLGRFMFDKIYYLVLH